MTLDTTSEPELDELEAGPDPRPERHDTLFPLIGALLGTAAIAAVLLISFALPAVKSGPHKLPIGVAGTPAITSQLAGLFTANGSKAFEVHTYTTDAALKTAIEHRKIYGGLEVTTTSATMLVSSAASETVSEALNSVASELGSSSGAQISVSDVVPLPSHDPRGTGLAGMEIPLGVAAVVPALLMIRLYRRRPAAQIGVAVLASAGIGLAGAAVTNYVLRSTEGSNYWLLAVAIGFGVLATSLVLLGLNALAGRWGAWVGAAILLLFGVPLSGLSTAPEWLPTPWGSIGQLLPPGAEATTLRSVAYFDRHGSGRALIVLAVWCLVGLLLLALGTLLFPGSDLADPEAAAASLEDEEGDEDEDEQPASSGSLPPVARPVTTTTRTTTASSTGPSATSTRPVSSLQDTELGADADDRVLGAMRPDPEPARPAATAPVTVEQPAADETTAGSESGTTSETESGGTSETESEGTTEAKSGGTTEAKSEAAAGVKSEDGAEESTAAESDPKA